MPPVAHVVTLPNKMGLLVVERHGTSIVAAELVARGGTAAFPGERPEAFLLMVETLMRGTATRSEGDIYGTMNAGLFDLETSAGDAWVSLRLRATTESFDVGLELLQDVALHPSFPARRRRARPPATARVVAA